MTVIDADRALEIAQHAVATDESPSALVVVADATEERAFGWVFVYTTKRYLETKDPNDLVPGNGPLVVLRADGSIVWLSSAGPPQRIVDDYEREWQSRQGGLP